MEFIMILLIRLAATLPAVAALLWSPLVLAHAFPQEAQPGVGAVLDAAPQQVRIRFDSRLEEKFSVIMVKDANGHRVSGKTKLDPDTHESLETELEALAPGDYHVYWSVVSSDGFRTKGDYVFHIKSK